jgi:uncharacterized membrane protein YphA (DoxX/SURF4 family)
MDDSIAHPVSAPSLETALWKSVLAWISAAAVAILFLSAGIWKATDPLKFSQLLSQLLVPGWLTLPGTVLLAISETFAGVLILIPRYRRWGALLASALLVTFMLYAGVNYDKLVGKECSCFPWIKRAIGPGFFAGDAAMLALAVVAGLWSQRPSGLRGAALVLSAIAVFCGVCVGVAMFEQQGLAAPPQVTVDGRPTSLNEGRVFLYFFDPECMHCFQAAKQMTTYRWKDVRVVGVPTRVQQFAGQFLSDTGLKAAITNDLDALRAVFKFQDPPYGVALESGRQKVAFPIFDEQDPRKGLREIGFIE